MFMKKVVIYKSKTGFTKKYAEWIAEEIGADIYEEDKTNEEHLLSYDLIVYGGGIYVSGISGVKLLTRNYEKIKDKKLIVFATCLSPIKENTESEIKSLNFTEQQQEKINFFLLRGGFDYKRLSFVDKLLMSILRLMLKSKKNPTPDEKGMLAVYVKSVDWTNKKYIDPIVKMCNE